MFALLDAGDGWEPPSDEGDHFDWAEFETLIARDPERSCPPMVPTPDACPSGPMAAHLDSGTIVADRLANGEVIDAIIGFDHLFSWAGARQARLLAEFARRRPGDDPAAGIAEKPRPTSRWAPDEIALALSQSRITAAAKLAQAGQLNEVLGATLAAWESGRLDGLKVRAICDATLRLDEANARAVEARVLPRAATQTLTQLKAALKRAVLAVDPDGGDARHRTAHRERRVVLTPADDGMATLWACMTAPDAQTCYGWLTALARGLGRDDPRGMDARRLDLMRDLLTGRLTIIPTDPDRSGTVPAPATSSTTSTGDSPSSTGTTSTEPTAAGTGGYAAGATTDTATTDTATTATATGEPATGEPATGEPATGEAATGEAATGEAATGEAAETDTADTAGATATGTGAGETRDVGADGHQAGCPGCACPTPPPPWRPAPVAPGKPPVQMIIPLTTLTGADDQPVELVGYGPLPPELARTLAADAVWKRLVTDPLSGTLLDHGRSLYRPPAALADFVRARHQTSRFPPCRRRALDIELDHTVAWTADGSTAERNLYGGCPHHHHLKHDAPGWTVTQTPDGLITWTTPTGHRYTSRPYDYRPEAPPPVATAKAAKEPAPVRPVLPDPWAFEPGRDDAPF